AQYLARCRADYAADAGPAGLATPPLLTGKDLRQAGLPPGPLYGHLLARVEDEQLEGRLRTRTEALNLALRLAREAGASPPP
ncbi:MAG: hypothetical protein D6731_07235, partial [Planctomycetota bacterium]